ncbi:MULTISPECIES: protoporphyrinogen oxidase HemJ [unclassified Oceanobacter]|uniref:protoporphyrinogen oxidase HemJ n=1 Tax=unclassified Oceanobacter TaxID=2620260 RepID=UPI0026E3CF2E|nr:MULTISPECIES: protoporphyrinogen oxidase HemJ [unclassified Oceanobacter]MDO6680968.1 protoporphyrinogen oxidase HemJ [Oceanobacter sp. 5_MG-2023]MDP2504729.1 protoporphyrinogen oxidase HemJ [Oceanobacter sp. 3_MG-2023]MDP2546813.1 protoporphyrinogen oxidase HemJ [Oceanobacter sp. 4_MG-2023]MDP2610481.1 protoporphyrinogen oxidase HemJ [Oceanobacter sp. 1_MG-2023]MDP2613737.1 protoporphyrinogen oxidase HemJ [Oceanobacter sp. 2_MG-2023]
MLWVKAFHIIAVITWFAGIFYLPRLYVYHAAAEDTASRERFKIMERKLYRGIMWPSMVVVIALGTWLISFNPAYYLQSGWLHAKLALVVLLVGYHLYCGKLNQMFKQDQNHRSHVWYRWFNELPVFVLIAIVILVVVRPF